MVEKPWTSHAPPHPQHAAASAFEGPARLIADACVRSVARQASAKERALAAIPRWEYDTLLQRRQGRGHRIPGPASPRVSALRGRPRRQPFWLRLGRLRAALAIFVGALQEAEAPMAPPHALRCVAVVVRKNFVLKGRGWAATLLELLLPVALMLLIVWIRTEIHREDVPAQSYIASPENNPTWFGAEARNLSQDLAATAGFSFGSCHGRCVWGRPGAARSLERGAFGISCRNERFRVWANIGATGVDPCEEVGR